MLDTKVCVSRTVRDGGKGTKTKIQNSDKALSRTTHRKRIIGLGYCKAKGV